MTVAHAELHFGNPSYPILAAYGAARDRMDVIVGPLGSGKTTGSVDRLLEQMGEQLPDRKGVRRTRWLAVRNTYLDLRKTTIPDFLAVFDALGIGKMDYGGGDEPPHWRGKWLKRVRRPDGTEERDGSVIETEVIFLALDKKRDVGKLRGYQITGFWLNEIKLIPFAITEMCFGRCGRYPDPKAGGDDRCPVHGTAPDRPARAREDDCVCCTWSGGFGDTNSYPRTHWLYKKEMDPPKGWRFFSQPPAVIDTGERRPNGRKIWKLNLACENLANLRKGYYEDDLDLHEDDWIEVELGNKRKESIAGMPVHPLFSQDVHVLKEDLEPNPMFPLVLGIDFGRWPACAVLQYWDTVDRWYLIDEMVGENVGAATFGRDLKHWLDREYKGFRISAWGDPAGEARAQTSEDTPILILQAAGIPVEPTDSNSPELRRAALDNPLTQLSAAARDLRPRFMVSPRCVRSIDALSGGFCFPEVQTTGDEPRYSQVALKNKHSHIGEAIEYGLQGGGEGQRALEAGEPQLRDSQPQSDYVSNEWHA